jgi:exodeoxyribonuclease V gamma subunit
MQPFFARPLEPPGPEWRTVSLAALAEFFRHPCRYLLRRRLALELRYGIDELDDAEPLLPEGPARGALAARLLPVLLGGADRDAARALALAGTELPGGAVGACALDETLDRLVALADAVRDATREACLPPHAVAVDVELPDGPWRLSAAIADLRPGGLVRWRAADTRTADYLDAWLHHLALCAELPAGVAPATHWLALDGGFSLRPVADARARIAQLLTLYRRGLMQPLPFFPKASWAVATSRRLSAARAKWLSNEQRPWGEESEPAHRLALRGVADPLDAEFVACADAVLEPLLAHLDDPRVKVAAR